MDERGRIFGRFNLVDSAVVLTAILLALVGVATYRVFRTPPPEIASVEPPVIGTNGDHRLALGGHDFRPYLRAFFTPSGQAVSFSELGIVANEATFLVERPTLAELKLPEIAPGKYDLYLYDEGREVARRLSAFTVIPPAAPIVAPPETAVVDATVRFDVDREILPMLKAGDADVGPVSAILSKPATLMSLGRVSDAERAVGLRLADGKVTAFVEPAHQWVDAVVRVEVAKDHGAWVSAGGQQIRTSLGFRFATSSYLVTGLITRMTVHPR
ncbi:MAG: hypothetical protein HY047_09210 [Acidobacteria bacterium]|nr:hypothetical protein [Acidobacteriota bacterium]